MFRPSKDQTDVLRYVQTILKSQLDPRPRDPWEEGFNTGVGDCISVLDNIIRGDFNYDQHLERLETLS